MLDFAELFAEVGGFRLGRVGASREHKSQLRDVFSNQWERSMKVQRAFNVYLRFWDDVGNSNENISNVPLVNVPEQDLSVEVCPCQDYFAARSAR